MAGESEVLHLWASPSPFCMRVDLALALKEVEYKKVAQDLRKKSQVLLEANPVYKKVPVLMHKGKAVCESSIIVQYVDEAWPSSPNLLPSDPFDKATARFWADFVDKKVFDPFFSILKSKGEDQKGAIQNAIAAMATLEEALATLTKDPPFFGGATPGFVDIMLGPLLAWLPAFEEVGNFTFPLDKYPHLQGWFSAFKEHPILGSILPEPSEIIDFVSKVILKR